jgi:hypothetical protein
MEKKEGKEEAGQMNERAPSAAASKGCGMREMASCADGMAPEEANSQPEEEG